MTAERQPDTLAVKASLAMRAKAQVAKNSPNGAARGLSFAARQCCVAARGHRAARAAARTADSADVEGAAGEGAVSSSMSPPRQADLHPSVSVAAEMKTFVSAAMTLWPGLVSTTGLSETDLDVHYDVSVARRARSGYEPQHKLAAAARPAPAPLDLPEEPLTPQSSRVARLSLSTTPAAVDAALEKSQQLLEKLAGLCLCDDGEARESLREQATSTISQPSSPPGVSPLASPSKATVTETAEVPLDVLNMLVELWELSQEKEENEETSSECSLSRAPLSCRKPIISPAAIRQAALAHALGKADTRFKCISKGLSGTPSTPTTAPTSPLTSPASLSECSSPRERFAVACNSARSMGSSSSSSDQVSPCPNLTPRSDAELVQKLRKALRASHMLQRNYTASQNIRAPSANCSRVAEKASSAEGSARSVSQQPPSLADSLPLLLGQVHR